MSDPQFHPRGARPLWTLRAEFLILYLLVPLIFALAVTPRLLFPMLFAMMIGGFALLHLTPGFRWRELLLGRVDLRLVVAFLLVSGLVLTAFVFWLTPGSFLQLPRLQPGLMLTIALFYPLLSALPQEVLFRALYFRRYRPFLPRGLPGILLNAALFAWAHLLYWNWVAVAVTFLGGIAFAYGYKRGGGFGTAVLMHAAAGLLLFALGLGRYFYSGAVIRPF